MNPALQIKQARAQRSLTQKQLAEAIGVSTSFITKLERGETGASYEIVSAISRVLGLDATTLWEAFEAVRLEAAQQRIRTRGAAVRGALRTRGRTRAPSPEDAEPQLTAEEIARDLAADDDLRAAYRDLKASLSNPQMRETVLNTLRAFARTVKEDS